MQRRLVIYILLILLGLSSANAQSLKAFPVNPEKFLEALSDFFKSEEIESTTKKEIRDFMDEQFSIAWTSGKYSEQFSRDIYQTCNLMLNKKMKAYPYFYNYLQCTYVLINSKQDEASRMAWQRGIRHILGLQIGFTSAFVGYIQFTKGLLNENAIAKTATTTWKSDNDLYYFQFDSVPKIIFPALNLSCVGKGDTAFIYSTKGVFRPLSSQWLGDGGRIDWSRADFDKSDVYAELKKYSISMRYSKYNADSVAFYFKKYFNHKLSGKIEDRVLTNKRGENASYPVFDSYDKRLQILEIFKNIDYEGGFLLKGSKVIGNGNKERNAYVYIKRNNMRFVKSESKTFQIRLDRLASADASVTFYLENDSIYHPSLRMKYLKSKNELSLVREQTGLGPSPYFDTYHKLDMYFEALYWKLDSQKIEMRMIKGQNKETKAVFESSKYFEQARFEEIEGMYEVHPLQIIANCSRKYQSTNLTVLELAKFMKRSPDDIKLFLIDICNRGFIIYNIEEEYFVIKDKLFDYLKAKSGKVDYDLLKFNSVISAKSNAEMSLLNFELKMNGIAYVLLSDSQNVYIYPSNQEITMFKNRNFIFSGRVHAGLFDFYGQKYFFDYDMFKLDMPNLDSLSFKVRSRTMDKDGSYPLVRVKTVIQDLKGDLLIDYPTNKSGFKPYDEYPIFNSKKNSYVYYDKRSIYNGVYKKNNFYFFVQPFTIDSLQTFSTDGLGFDGTMKTAEIFPEFEEKLKVQEDYSLGFIRSTPPEGFPAYGGKGNYLSTIKMSHKGLKGDGELKYLSSLSKSNEFNFFSDSMNAVVQNYTMTEQLGDVEYPPVQSTDLFEQWYPYKDLMIMTSMKTPISMYKGEAKFTGKMDVSPQGVIAHGKQEFKDAELVSRNMSLKHHIIDSDTADFGLKSIDLGQFSIKTHNYKSHIDFALRKGQFKANAGRSMVEFPVNKYICYIDQFEWMMDKEEIDFVSKEKQYAKEDYDKKTLAEIADVDIVGSRWVSIHPAQDSLEFYSPIAKFSVRTNIITAKEVKIIKVADAAIYPDKGEVTILKDAEMKTLENAQIMANLVSKYHVFYNTTVNVKSKKRYKASGKYDYIDENKDKEQIYFDKIDVDTTGQTYAIGLIAPSANFTLSPYFEYKGEVNLLASLEYLTFNGACRIRQHCDSTRSWLKFKSEINPSEIYIPVPEQPLSGDSTKIVAGILVSSDSVGVYSAFLQPKKHYNDKIISTAKGFLYFDKISSEYRISSIDKLKQLALPVDYLSLGVNECVAYGEGTIQLGTDLGQVKLNSFGNVKYQIIPDSTDISMVLGIDFYFADNCMKLISQSVEKATNLQGINLASMTYSKALGQILGTAQADKIISDINVYGYIKRFPEELRHTFFFSDIKFIWNQKTRSYTSSGLLGLGGIYKNQFNKYVNGYIEIEKQRSGDAISIYLEVSSSEWYFFNYKRGIMQVISSNEEFNKIIKETKSKDKSIEVKKGETPYSYTISTVKKKESFVNKFKNND